MTQEQLIEELKKLGMLHDSGVLTDEEFQEMKQKLLGQSISIENTDDASESVGNTIKREKNVLQGYSEVNQDANSDYNTPLDIPQKMPVKYAGESDHADSNKLPVIPKIGEEEPIAAFANNEVYIDNESSNKLSKKNILIISIIAILVVAIGLFFLLRKSDYEKALDKIENQQGIILANVHDSNLHVLMYSTPKGLFYWDLRNKEPKRLYSNIDSLKVHGYYLNQDYGLEEYDTEYPKEIEYFDNEGQKYRPNVIQSVSPLKLYKVEWPWIMIGKHYVAHVSNPNRLINVVGDEKGDIFEGLPDLFDPESKGDYAPSSVDIDKNGNLVLELGEYAFNLPGLKDYKPTYIDENTWKNNVYIDNDLVQNYGNLFQSEYELERAIGISLPLETFVYRKVVINPYNKVASNNEFVWGDYSFEESNLSPNGMQSIYKSIERKYSEIIEETLPKKRTEIEQYAEEYRKNMIARIKEEALPLSQLTEAYIGNSRRASEIYPLNQNYVIRAYIDKIEYINNGSYRYRLLVSSVFKQTYFYSSDNNFANLTYPCTVYMNTQFYDYRIERNYMGSIADDCYFFFINATLLYADE